MFPILKDQLQRFLCSTVQMFSGDDVIPINMHASFWSFLREDADCSLKANVEPSLTVKGSSFKEANIVLPHLCRGANISGLLLKFASTKQIFCAELCSLSGLLAWLQCVGIKTVKYKYPEHIILCTQH